MSQHFVAWYATNGAILLDQELIELSQVPLGS
jgi:hypothetical protein